MSQLVIKEKKPHQFLPIVMILLLFIVSGFMFYMAFREQIPYWIADHKNRNMQEQYTNFEDKDMPEADRMRNTNNKDFQADMHSGFEASVVPQDWNGVDWNGLKKVNPDIIGWIRIPDLAVDYAILKGTSGDYYLNHHMDGSENILGSIFAADGTSDFLDDAHTILYGHNMASGRMFGQLSFYSDVDFWKEHPYVYVYTPYKTLTLAIYNVYNCLDSDETYTLGYTMGSEDFKEWIAASENKGKYKTEFIPTGNEQIFTLSTCADYGTENNRFVANCMVIKEENKSSELAIR